MDLQVYTESESNHVWYSLITLSDDTDLKPLMTTLSLNDCAILNDPITSLFS